MVKHQEGEIFEVPISEFYSSWTLKQQKNYDTPILGMNLDLDWSLGNVYRLAVYREEMKSYKMVEKHIP